MNFTIIPLSQPPQSNTDVKPFRQKWVTVWSGHAVCHAHTHTHTQTHTYKHTHTNTHTASLRPAEALFLQAPSTAPAFVDGLILDTTTLMTTTTTFNNNVDRQFLSGPAQCYPPHPFQTCSSLWFHIRTRISSCWFPVSGLLFSLTCHQPFKVKPSCSLYTFHLLQDLSIPLHFWQDFHQ